MGDIVVIASGSSTDIVVVSAGVASPVVTVGEVGPAGPVGPQGPLGALLYLEPQDGEDGLLGISSGLQALLASSDGSTHIGFLQTGTGAVGRPLRDKLLDSVSVFDFMTAAQIADARSGAPVLDHTAPIQGALATGKNIDFVGGTFNANNLTQSANFQTLYSSAGIARIIKNANGDLFTSSGQNVCVCQISFRGESATPAFTGNNVTASGSNFSMINSGSRWAYGRAVKATGGHVQIIGTSDLYQTADVTPTGYDIEIGLSGTSTLYHELIGIYSSQDTGGILLIDTGAHTIHGGQFGKLHIAKGTGPAGVNGGKTIGARILGNVTVEAPSAVFSSNQFGVIVFTFSIGTSACAVDASNTWESGSSAVNNGNSNNLIERGVGGSALVLQYGPDADVAQMFPGFDGAGGFKFSGGLAVPPNKIFYSFLADGVTLAPLLYVYGANSNVAIGHALGAAFAVVNSGTGGLYLASSGVSRFQVQDGTFVPQVDNSYNLGSPSQRFGVVYAGTGTINTSDERSKQDIEDIPIEWLKAWGDVKWQRFRFRDAVQAKGNGARWHVGLLAQRVRDVFVSHGLDAFSIGLLCYDEWQEKPEVLGEDGAVIAPAISAANRYGIRYDEALAMECAFLRWKAGV